jgi:hypothetical protein
VSEKGGTLLVGRLRRRYFLRFLRGAPRAPRLLGVRQALLGRTPSGSQFPVRALTAGLKSLRAPILRSVLLLTLIHVCLALTRHLVWAAGGGTLSRVLARGRARALDAVTRVALLFLAARVWVGGNR